MKLTDIKDEVKFYTALAACAALYVAHFACILKYAVNIPYWDEWEAVAPGGIIDNQTVSQLFAQHNEHRIITTKILTLALYKLDGWNLITHQALNFIIYGLLILLIVRTLEKYVPQLPTWITLSFVIFLFSTVNHENFFWGFQTQFHFTLLFMLLAVRFLFDETQSRKTLLGGVFFSWLTIYSTSGGMIETIVILAAYVCFKLVRRRQPENKPAEIRQLAIVSILIGGAIALYFVGYIKPEGHPPLVLPHRVEFWHYFLNLLSGGFGFDSLKQMPGMIILLFTLVPVAGEIWKKRFQLPNGSWTIIVSILAVMGLLCSITMGRAGFMVVEQSKSSRYAEFVCILIPLGLAMWAIFLGERVRLRNYLYLLFWIFCAVGFARYWDFPKTYSAVAQERIKGAQCVSGYYHGGGKADCPTVYPAPIADRLEFDRKLKLSFVYENTK